MKRFDYLKFGAGTLLVVFLLAPAVSHAQAFTSAERDRIILQLLEQVQTLQRQLDALEKKINGQTATTTVNTLSDEERAKLEKERNKITAAANWWKSTSKVKRVNEITKILGYGCRYEIVGRGHLGAQCGG